MSVSHQDRITSSALFASALLVGALSGCGDDTPAGDNTETGTSTTTTGTGTDGPGDDSPGTTTTTTTGTGTSGDTGDTEGGEDTRQLGDTSTPDCEAALVQLNLIVEANAADEPDAAAVEAAYEGTALQTFVRTYGEMLGRVDGEVLLDDQAILDTLANETVTAEDLVDVETRVVTLMALGMRQRLNDVANALPDPERDPAVLYGWWDEAYCYWNGALRVHATEADELGLDELESIEADIQAGFETGHAGIESDEAAFAIDPWIVPAAKQVAEKSMYRAYDRLITKYAALAAENADAVAARRALGYFQIVEDRMEGRNTPAIATIEAALGEGAPEDIDAAAIRRDLNIAWIKRTRRYTDLAIELNLVGEADGYKGAAEGRTYAKVALPFMVDALENFDAQAHLDAWSDYLEAIRTGDQAAAETASATLTEANCAYQTELGIAECTGTEDEVVDEG